MLHSQPRFLLDESLSHVVADALSLIYTYPDNAVLHLYNDTSHLNGV